MAGRTHIGYEHSFVHAVADFITAVEENKTIEPNFYDGVKITEVLDAGLRSAEEKKQIIL